MNTDPWSNEATAFMAIANVDRAPFRTATKKETVEVKYEFGNSLTYTKTFETDKDWKVNLSDPANSVNWYKCDAVDFDTMAYIVYPYVAPSGSKIPDVTPVEYVLQINEKFATQGLKIKNLFNATGELLASTGFTTDGTTLIGGTKITHLVSKIDLDAAQFAAVNANLVGLKYVTLLANTKLPALALGQANLQYFNLPLVSEVAANAITLGASPSDVYMGSFNFNENAAKHAIFTDLCEKGFLKRADVSAVPVIGEKFPWLGLTFKDFALLEEIRVMNGVILGGQAFMGCTELKVVNYPAVGGAVVLEGDQAFSGCDELTAIATSTTNIPDNSFNGCTLLADIAPAEGTAGTGVTIKPTTVGVGAFKDCKAITDINLDLATVIKANAFNGCTSLVGRYEADKNRTVLRVNAINIIEPGSFAGCNHIRFISFKNATKLGIGCFTGSGMPLPGT
ncbi:MAG: leucine-rich repeat domain-containing protein, partial [Oscillospiraceae bacterium]